MTEAATTDKHAWSVDAFAAASDGLFAAGPVADDVLGEDRRRDGGIGVRPEGGEPMGMRWRPGRASTARSC